LAIALQLRRQGRSIRKAFAEELTRFTAIVFQDKNQADYRLRSGLTICRTASQQVQTDLTSEGALLYPGQSGWQRQSESVRVLM